MRNNANVDVWRQERPRLTYHDEIGWILPADIAIRLRNLHVLLKRFVYVNKATQVCLNRNVWHSILSAYWVKNLAWRYVIVVVIQKPTSVHHNLHINIEKLILKWMTDEAFKSYFIGVNYTYVINKYCLGFHSWKYRQVIRYGSLKRSYISVRH